MGRTRDVSKILTSNTSILSLASASSIYQTIDKTGLVEITPSTISVSGGSGSISATGAVSFTSASAISLNDVFSATYDNYRIVLTATNSVGNSDLNFRLRFSGTDNSSANYHRQRFTSSSTSNAGTRTTGGTNAVLGELFTSNSMIVTDICSPFVATPTTFISNGNYNGTSPIIMIHNNFHNVSDSFTGFTIFPASNNISGIVSVYGYNK
jgi:hypothetical protein